MGPSCVRDPGTASVRSGELGMSLRVAHMAVRERHEVLLERTVFRRRAGFCGERIQLFRCGFGCTGAALEPSSVFGDVAGVPLASLA